MNAQAPISLLSADAYHAALRAVSHHLCVMERSSPAGERDAHFVKALRAAFDLRGLAFGGDLRVSCEVQDGAALIQSAAEAFGDLADDAGRTLPSGLDGSAHDRFSDAAYELLAGYPAYERDRAGEWADAQAWLAE